MNADALKEFLFRNVEKFIFGLLVLVALFLIYQGVTKPDILAKHQPEKMQQSATQVKGSIDTAGRWDMIKETRITDVNIVARTNETIKPVDPTPYVLPVPWESKSVDLSLKRGDPKIPVPIELQVTGVVASLAIKSAGVYALKTLEQADPIVKVEKPKPKPKRNRMNMEGMESMYGSGMEGMEGMDSSYGEGMGGIPGAVAVTPIRKVDATLYDQGFRPVGALTDVQPTVGQFIAGVALMPQKQIYEAFEEALSQADGYNLQRDQPFYLGFELQRADVTNKPVEQLVDADWVLRGTSRYYQQLLLKVWSGMAKEVVAGKYRDAELTAAIPPVLLDHYSWFATHPKIPVGDEPLPGSLLVDPKKTELPAGPILPGDGGDVFKNRARAGAMMQSGGYGDPGMMSGMEGGYGGGYGANPYGAGAKVEQPDFKLIRFYDFRSFKGDDPGSPQPGRKYVYRIRIAVEDPNFPANPMADPRTSTLSSEVFRRVEKLKTGSAEMLKKDPQAMRSSSLWSEFSTPSPVVSLPSLNEAFAGPVDPGTVKSYTVGATQIEFNSKAPKGKAVVVQFDPKLGASLPVFADVGRGSVLNKTGVIEVPDPVMLEVRKTPEQTVNTSNVVLDLTGGKELAIAKTFQIPENQTEPGMILMFDPMGGLKVVDEISTQRGFRLYSFADERGE